MNAALRQVLARNFSAGAAEEPDQDIPDWAKDPEKVAYLNFLIDAVERGQSVVASYTLVCLAVILVLAAIQYRQTRRDRRRWVARLVESDPGSAESKPGSDGGGARGLRLAEGHEEGFSSSSSTLREGDVTPPDPKQVEVDLEDSPLLSSPDRLTRSRRRQSHKLFWTIRAWLTYQPGPIPIINRQLPSNGTSLFVLAFVSVNVFLQFYQLPLAAKYFFAFADRSGYVFIVNLPLLYLLAAKTQPLKALTGRSYEALNIFHRRLGELMCFVALVHMVSMLVWRIFLEPEWLRGGSLREYMFHPLILEGFGAFASYELLYFTSLASFRQRWYEAFLASHVVLQTVALAFLWLHFDTSRPYVACALAVFLLDRLVWRLTLKSMTTTADLTILPDGQTLLLTADWTIPPSPQPGLLARLLGTHNLRLGWQPTDHVFLTVPGLGRTHALQAHPFTIASAAPSTSHAHLALLIRAHAGFTAALLARAAARPRALPVRLDGPYGSPRALAALRAADAAVLVAAGSGAAVVCPLAEALLAGRGGRRRQQQRVRMLWVVRARPHRAWVADARLRRLVRAGLELVVPDPTAEAGRPDVSALVRGWVAEAGEAGAEVAVVVSGPDGVNRRVVGACAREIARGLRVRVVVEKFGW